MIRAIVFDLDGTLIDSRRDIAASANHALAANGFSELSLEEIEGYVGDGARALLARSARLDESDSRVDALVEAFLDYYTAHPIDSTSLMPGAREALAAFPSTPLALCTNKPRRTTLAVLAGLGLTETFRAVSAGGDHREKKPHPRPILALGEVLSVPPAAILMVGDGAQDVLAGRAAGAVTVGVRGGIQPVERLLEARPDHLLETLHELPGLVTKLGVAGTPP
jgi:phosphoglycolate phosphatase